MKTLAYVTWWISGIIVKLVVNWMLCAYDSRSPLANMCGKLPGIFTHLLYSCTIKPFVPSVFLRSDVAAANFSLFILVGLLIEGGYYSMAAFISLGAPDCAATIWGWRLIEELRYPDIIHVRKYTRLSRTVNNRKLGGSLRTRLQIPSQRPHTQQGSI